VTAPEPIRRQINQGFFVKLFIGQDGSVERAELTEPFAALLSPDLSARMAAEGACGAGGPSRAAQTAGNEPGDSPDGTQGRTAERAPTGQDDEHHMDAESDNNVTPSNVLSFAAGVQDKDLVGAAGFEPATARV
jgi:hypothetical protein